ncbi:MAG TPA: UDP-glucose--hexose-1-phosphate uridylyltransferase [Candidatus Limnocylindrales bacterium]|nr:UDP-glucose--hexose-1-phosphate uridylyltransferase [Candidatus Limnocylindrales bacterium]
MSKDLTPPMLLSQPHRRYNALSGEWLLVSAERTNRPWLGHEEFPQPDDLPIYDPSCYLCPGNVRANGERNPRYDSTFVFTNDFSALRPDSPAASFSDGLLRAESERGECLVTCFSPRHDLSMSRMNAAQARTVVDLWATETASLGRRFEWVQVFENRGSAMGASNVHPHGQIWAGNARPREAEREDATQRRHFETTGHSLLIDYAQQEADGPRDLGSDDNWLVVVPFWAAWPFETLVIPRRPVSRLPDLDDRARNSLANRLIGLLRGYDELFDEPFPYSMGWHQAPFDGIERPYWQLHAHFYPPLLQATVRKFMVGYELLSEPQRDITAEEAAERLRSAINAADPAVAQPGG